MDPKALADAGGWAVVVAMITAAGFGAVRGWWVPGFVYRHEVERGDTMTTQVERNTDALRDLTRALETKRPKRRA